MSINISPLEGEDVLLSVRKTPIRYWRQLLLCLGLVATGFLSLYFGSNEYLYILSICIFFITAGIVCTYWYIWFNDVYIITNKRLVLVDKKGIFGHTVSEIDVRDISGVSYTQKGILQSLLSYGLVGIVGRNDLKVELDYIPNPDEVHAVVRTIYTSLAHNHKN